MKTITQLLSVMLLGIAMLSCGDTATQGSVAQDEAEVTKPKTTIHEASFFGNIDELKQHIAYGSDLNEKDQYGSTPLNIALTFGKNDVAKMLIDGGADLNVTSADGSTPLHTASLFGRVEAVKFLLQKNIGLEAKNSYGSTALEIVEAPFEQMKPIYDQLSRDLGPMGFKLDYDRLQENRNTIAGMLGAAMNDQSK